MMRTTYQIMKQTKGEEARVIYTSSRKRETEVRFNRMYREHKAIKSWSVNLIREGYFRQSYYNSCTIVDTEYWICKA
jgi:hypothetical protein